VIKTAFDAWVSEAEQKFLLAADYPLIDDDQIDMAEELRDCANRVVQEFFGEESTSEPAQIEPTIEFFELRLIGSESALPVQGFRSLSAGERPGGLRGNLACIEERQVREVPGGIAFRAWRDDL
jgi:hypothetical protein